MLGVDASKLFLQIFRLFSLSTSSIRDAAGSKFHRQESSKKTNDWKNSETYKLPSKMLLSFTFVKRKRCCRGGLSQRVWRDLMMRQEHASHFFFFLHQRRAELSSKVPIETCFLSISSPHADERGKFAETPSTRDIIPEAKTETSIWMPLCCN